MPKATIALPALLLLCLSGCHALSRPGGDMTVQSLTQGTFLTPEVRTAVYRRIDANTADLFFSDIPEDRLVDPTDDLQGAAGSIVHMHFFLRPSAGNTPIDDTACNATIRHVVLAPPPGGGLPAFGIYGGGGFLFPIGEVGDAAFGGTMRNGTHRLLSSSPGFTDLLGPSAIGGKMIAARDDDAAAAISARIDRFARAATLAPAPPRPAEPAPE